MLLLSTIQLVTGTVLYVFESELSVLFSTVFVFLQICSIVKMLLYLGDICRKKRQ
jgi:hypothetical protein